MHKPMTDNHVSHATHDLVECTAYLERTQGLKAQGAKRLANQYRDRYPDTAQFFDDMAELLTDFPDDPKSR